MSCKLILSLDGGGIRGAFDLQILNFIELELKKKISDVFDLVVGVSSGSAIAALIATRKYDDITTPFQDSGKILRHKQPRGPIFESKYDGTGKTEFLKDVYGEIKLGDIDFPLAVLTSTMEGESKLFTSWNPNHKKIPLVKVIDASTAVPTYFPPVEINDSWYIDGGIISNDPVLYAVSMAKKRWGDEVKIRVLSIGASVKPRIRIDVHDRLKFGILTWLQKGIIDVISSKTELYNDVIPQIVGKGNYMRVSSPTTSCCFDDNSIERYNKLTVNAREFFKKHGKDITTWIKSQTVMVD